MSNDDERRLEQQLLAKFLDNCEAAKRLKPPLRSPIFLRMLTEHGAQETANRLLTTREPSDGFGDLYLTGNKENLKFSLEYTVLLLPWRVLFADDQLAVARTRLQEVHC